MPLTIDTESLWDRILKLLTNPAVLGLLVSLFLPMLQGIFPFLTPEMVKTLTQLIIGILVPSEIVRQSVVEVSRGMTDRRRIASGWRQSGDGTWTAPPANAA